MRIRGKGKGQRLGCRVEVPAVIVTKASQHEPAAGLDRRHRDRSLEVVASDVQQVIPLRLGETNAFGQCRGHIGDRADAAPAPA